jgi:hypothetical protein
MARDKRMWLLRSGGNARWLFFSLHFAGLRTYISDLKPFLEEQGRKEREAWEAEQGKGTPLWGHYTDVLPSILRDSFIVTLMIELEELLTITCENVGLIVRSPIRFEDVNGDIVIRAEKFLTAFGGFKHPQPHRWAEVRKIWKRRNEIVHSKREKFDLKSLRARRQTRPLHEFIDKAAKCSPPVTLPQYLHAVVEAFLKDLYAEYGEFLEKQRTAEGISSPYDFGDGLDDFDVEDEA